MDALRAAMDADDVQAIHEVLKRAVEGYHRELRHLPQPANGSSVASPNRTRH